MVKAVVVVVVLADADATASVRYLSTVHTIYRFALLG
jgi:hypothetical protein